MHSLLQYNSDTDESNEFMAINLTSLKEKYKLNVVPDVWSNTPTWNEMRPIQVGPENIFKTDSEKMKKNVLSGLYEASNYNSSMFENQRRTFESFGYADDPENINVKLKRVPDDNDSIGKSVFENTKNREGDKRKRFEFGDPGNVDNYLGPWANYADFKSVSKPTDDEMKVLNEFRAIKEQMRTHYKFQDNDDDMQDPVKHVENATVHVEKSNDYQGRSYMDIPNISTTNLKSDAPPERCFLPKKHIHTWKAHSRGVTAIRLFPKSGHLLLSSGLDCNIMLREIYNDRRLLVTYTGHTKAVRDICFNSSGENFLSCSYDKMIKLWDTETGKCISRFSNNKIPLCVKFNPHPDRQNLFIAGTSDKKMITWDIRDGKITQKYERHLGGVNTITFFNNGNQMATTSDDKSIRVWDWDIPVDSKYIADPSMHSMPSAVLSPTDKWVAFQSMDNKIIIYNTKNKFRQKKNKVFRGHMIAGYACQIGFSPDQRYLSSGDADGKLFIWDFKTSRIFGKFKAHDSVCIGCEWLPHETSKILTCGWDGLIKIWS